jgi:L-serine dehydratase
VAAAAAFSEVFGSDAARTERACVLAASPTVGVPCTPRVMVSGLCAAHIGGAVVLGWTAAWISRWSDIPVSVPFDQMMALAAATHPISARHIVPTVIGYMEPFFKTNAEVDRRVATSVIEEEKRRRIRARDGALAEARALAAVAGSIVRPFGEAVVGGSSQAVGSPANTARIAHAMSTGKIRGMTIELYSELFARRAINVPAIVMCGLYGASTADGAAYASAMERAGADGVTVEVLETGTPQLQKITLRTDDGVFMAAALNRGGARLVLVDASPSLTRAREEAEKMGLETVER